MVANSRMHIFVIVRSLEVVLDVEARSLFLCAFK